MAKRVDQRKRRQRRIVGQNGFQFEQNVFKARPNWRQTHPNCPTGATSSSINRDETPSRIKAPAIRARKIHIAGSPELKIEGTPVYLDVEGLPDNDSEPTARLDLPRWHTHA